MSDALFRWLEPGVLAGGAHPDPYGDPSELARALAAFRAAHIGALVTVHEIPLALPDGAGFSYLHLPTDDGEPPEDLEAICQLVDAAKLRGVGTFVHCAAGVGRTGTALAAYLIWSGIRTAGSAIDEVRARYHRSAVETPNQVTALEAFARRHKLL
jgi:atypical dual specificity phosphatase